MWPLLSDKTVQMLRVTDIFMNDIFVAKQGNVCFNLTVILEFRQDFKRRKMQKSGTLNAKDE
jgi:hypothetical protein